MSETPHMTNDEKHPHLHSLATTDTSLRMDEMYVKVMHSRRTGSILCYAGPVRSSISLVKSRTDRLAQSGAPLLSLPFHLPTPRAAFASEQRQSSGRSLPDGLLARKRRWMPWQRQDEAEALLVK